MYVCGYLGGITSLRLCIWDTGMFKEDYNQLIKNLHKKLKFLELKFLNCEFQDQNAVLLANKIPQLFLEGLVFHIQNCCSDEGLALIISNAQKISSLVFLEIIMTEVKTAKAFVKILNTQDFSNNLQFFRLHVYFDGVRGVENLLISKMMGMKSLLQLEFVVVNVL